MAKLLKMTKTRARAVALNFLTPERLKRTLHLAEEMSQLVEKGTYDMLPEEVKDVYDILKKHEFVITVTHPTLYTKPDKAMGISARIQNFYLPNGASLLMSHRGLWNISNDVFDKLTALSQQIAKIEADIMLQSADMERELMRYTYVQEAEYAHPEWFKAD